MFWRRVGVSWDRLGVEGVKRKNQLIVNLPSRQMSWELKKNCFLQRKVEGIRKSCCFTCTSSSPPFSLTSGKHSYKLCNTLKEQQPPFFLITLRVQSQPCFSSRFFPLLLKLPHVIYVALNRAVVTFSGTLRTFWHRTSLMPKSIFLQAYSPKIANLPLLLIHLFWGGES